MMEDISWLSARDIQRHLTRRREEIHSYRAEEAPPAPLPWKVDVLEVTDSTNDEVWRRATPAETARVLFAERQTAGRGRRGDAWHSPVGENLLLSALIRPELEPRYWPRISQAAGLAVRQVVDDALEQTGSQLKWPNDVYFDGRKIAGILVERRESPDGMANAAAIIGIGLNVNAQKESFPQDLAFPATSLRLESGRNWDRNEVAARLLFSLERYLGRLDRFSELREEILGCSYLLNREVTAETPRGSLRGRVTGLAENGELLLETAPGAETIMLYSADRIRVIEE